MGRNRWGPLVRPIYFLVMLLKVLSKEVSRPFSDQAWFCQVAGGSLRVKLIERAGTQPLPQVVLTSRHSSMSLRMKRISWFSSVLHHRAEANGVTERTLG